MFSTPGQVAFPHHTANVKFPENRTQIVGFHTPLELSVFFSYVSSSSA